jgi:hypothetical protein
MKRYACIAWACLLASWFGCAGADPGTTGARDGGGGGAGNVADGSGAVVDASAPIATDGFAFDSDGAAEGALALGRCVLGDGASDCTGETGEAQRFAPLAEDDAMRIVRGPQGSFMLVLMLRTTGVDGGDPASPASPNNPSVEVQLRSALDGAIVSRFRGRVLFEPATGAANDQLESSNAIFVVVDGQEQRLVGETVVLEAVLQDRFGQRRRGIVRVRVDG